MWNLLRTWFELFQCQVLNLWMFIQEEWTEIHGWLATFEGTLGDYLIFTSKSRVIENVGKMGGTPSFNWKRFEILFFITTKYDKKVNEIVANCHNCAQSPSNNYFLLSWKESLKFFSDQNRVRSDHSNSSTKKMRSSLLNGPS